MKKISVIMPIYNEKLSWVKESVNSILAQNYKCFELIIVLDDPNNSELKKYLQQTELDNEKVKLIINEQNLGIVETLNRGLDYSSGELIARMDGDDIAFSNRLKTESDFLCENNLDLVTTTVCDINEKDTILLSRKQSDVIGKEFKKQIQYKTLGAHPTWLGTKAMFQSLDGYRKISHAEDLDFMLRALEHKYSLGLMGTPSIKYRVRDNSITATNKLEMFVNTLSLRNFFLQGMLSETDVQKILTLSKQVTQQDREFYDNISKSRKDLFYLSRENKLKVMKKLPQFVFKTMTNRYGRMLIYDDFKRLFKFFTLH